MTIQLMAAFGTTRPFAAMQHHGRSWAGLHLLDLSLTGFEPVIDKSKNEVRPHRGLRTRQLLGGSRPSRAPTAL